jgi:hypothetical protein
MTTSIRIAQEPLDHSLNLEAPMMESPNGSSLAKGRTTILKQNICPMPEVKITSRLE